MAALLGLGINKQLDVQSLFTGIGRHLAHDQGWYDERAKFQLFFILALSVLTLCLIIVAFLVVGKAGKRERMALAGLAALSSFVVIRAASFHHVDAMLGTRIAALRLNHLLELGGIALIAVPAFWQGRRLKSSRRRRSNNRGDVTRKGTRAL